MAEKRLIDAEAVSKRLKDESINQMEQSPDGRGDREARAFADAWRMVKDAPTVEAVEVVHGEWNSLTDCSNAGVYCSVCHKKVWKEDYAWCNRKNKIRSNYCPNCGAKMDGERKKKDDEFERVKVDA